MQKIWKLQKLNSWIFFSRQLNNLSSTKLPEVTSSVQILRHDHLWSSSFSSLGENTVGIRVGAREEYVLCYFFRRVLVLPRHTDTTLTAVANVTPIRRRDWTCFAQLPFSAIDPILLKYLTSHETREHFRTRRTVYPRPTTWTRVATPLFAKLVAGYRGMLLVVPAPSVTSSTDRWRGSAFPRDGFCSLSVSLSLSFLSLSLPLSYSVFVADFSNGGRKPLERGEEKEEGRRWFGTSGVCARSRRSVKLK